MTIEQYLLFDHRDTKQSTINHDLWACQLICTHLNSAEAFLHCIDVIWYIFSSLEHTIRFSLFWFLWFRFSGAITVKLSRVDCTGMHLEAERCRDSVRDIMSFCRSLGRETSTSAIPHTLDRCLQHRDIGVVCTSCTEILFVFYKFWQCILKLTWVGHMNDVRKCDLALVRFNWRNIPQEKDQRSRYFGTDHRCGCWTVFSVGGHQWRSSGRQENRVGITWWRDDPRPHVPAFQCATITNHLASVSRRYLVYGDDDNIVLV